MEIQGRNSAEFSTGRVTEWLGHICAVSWSASIKGPLGVSGHVFRLRIFNVTVGSVSEERTCFPNQVGMRRGGGKGLQKSVMRK